MKKPISGNNELNIVKAPVNLKGHWDDYYLEIIGLIGVFVYALNFYTGKSINNRMANAWFEHHKKLLSDAFYIVGDDGVSKEVSEGVLVKESENRFVVWCTGRIGCEGIKIEIKLLRRQDLISVLSQIFKPQSDTITITTFLAPEDMDSVVLAVMPRKGLKRLQQEVQDLAHFATEKKTEKFDLPSQLGILSEFSEVSNEFSVGSCLQKLSLKTLKCSTVSTCLTTTLDSRYLKTHKLKRSVRSLSSNLSLILLFLDKVGHSVNYNLVSHSVILFIILMLILWPY